MLAILIDLMERGLIPDACLRLGIRQLCRERLKSLSSDDPEIEADRQFSYVVALKRSAIAFATEKANQQHYELPPSFYDLVLGQNKKYSSGFWPEGCHSLDAAEDFALDVTINRAEISDGMRILDLGCGWGSLTLKLAQRFPKAQIVGLSNSHSQKKYIEAKAKTLGLPNVEIVTGDIAVFAGSADWAGSFDRVLSVEMLEHIRNYEVLFEKVSSWMKPQAKLFVHIFTHRQHAYLFETEGNDNWMGKYFFTGGQMPSHHLLSYFQKDLLLENQWAWSGVHYQKTSEAWLKNLDHNKVEALKILETVYGVLEAARWLERWRVFFMSCAELFGYDHGREWGVSHYLFSNRTRKAGDLS